MWIVVIVAKVIYDLPKMLTDKSQVCAVELVLLEYSVPSIKKASWVFSLGDFVLGSLFCAQRLWILNLFSADTEIWASRFDWLRNQHEFPYRRPHFNPRTYFVRPTTKLAISNLSVSSPGSVFHPCSPKWDEIREDIGRSRLCQTWELFFHKA